MNPMVTEGEVQPQLEARWPLQLRSSYQAHPFLFPCPPQKNQRPRECQVANLDSQQLVRPREEEGQEGVPAPTVRTR